MVNDPPASTGRRHLDFHIAVYKRFRATGTPGAGADSSLEMLRHLEDDALALTALDLSLFDLDSGARMLERLSITVALSSIV